MDNVIILHTMTCFTFDDQKAIDIPFYIVYGMAPCFSKPYTSRNCTKFDI